MTATAWSILPPIITIILALWTKEVYMSLIIGIFSGAMLFAGGNFLQATLTMFQVMADKVGGNVNILVFLVILGILVAAITRSGAMNAYGEWATRTIKGKRSASLVTVLLGIVIFIDDYFNCLTVGTVMRPVTDKFQIARTKLAYIIDATAAPICIIAPVSSWAAAVGSSLPEDSPIDGFMLFLQTIPFNLYAWLTILFMLYIIWTGRDFGAMRRSVEKSNVEFEIPKEYQDTAEASASAASEGHGKMIDLVLPCSSSSSPAFTGCCIRAASTRARALRRHSPAVTHQNPSCSVRSSPSSLRGCSTCRAALFHSTYSATASAGDSRR